jgi:hypothetical protein
MMTSIERAEKIAKKLILSVEEREYIAVEIEKAVKEATSIAFQQGELSYGLRIAQAKSEAFEEAAMIVERYDPRYLKNLITMKRYIAKEIRRFAVNSSGESDMDPTIGEIY